MLLEEMRDNSTVFIDANIFLYSIAGHGLICSSQKKSNEGDAFFSKTLPWA